MTDRNDLHRPRRLELRTNESANLGVLDCFDYGSQLCIAKQASVPECILVESRFLTNTATEFGAGGAELTTWSEPVLSCRVPLNLQAQRIVSLE